jgi:hypothetical protein
MGRKTQSTTIPANLVSLSSLGEIDHGPLTASAAWPGSITGTGLWCSPLVAACGMARPRAATSRPATGTARCSGGPAGPAARRPTSAIMVVAVFRPNSSSMYVRSTVRPAHVRLGSDRADAGLPLRGTAGVDAAAELVDGGHEVAGQTDRLSPSRHGDLLHVLPGPGRPGVGPLWRTSRPRPSPTHLGPGWRGPGSAGRSIATTIAALTRWPRRLTRVARRGTTMARR